VLFLSNLIRYYLIKFILQVPRFLLEVAVEDGAVDSAGVKALALAPVKAAAKAMEAEKVPVLEMVKVAASAASAAAAAVVKVVALVPDLALVVELV
jgi:hypothetical protein